MLNAFPELIDLWLLGAFFIRITVGLLFVAIAYTKLFGKRKTFKASFHSFNINPESKVSKIFTGIKLVLGILLTIGLFTQVVASLLALFALGAVNVKVRNHNLVYNDLSYYVLIFMCCIALLFLGPGAFGIDLQL